MIHQIIFNTKKKVYFFALLPNKFLVTNEMVGFELIVAANLK